VVGGLYGADVPDFQQTHSQGEEDDITDVLADGPWAASDTGDSAETEGPEDLLLTVFFRILATLGLLALALVAFVVTAIV
jgi:hypothetical protein